ncbi:A24 family peptidase [Oleidesulfovibrio alaskensis]|jgi:prepilin peptidase CpaA|uniref:A24 family peptidase n=1 Tax=Oleidesulfovibrio alaskensis TaxID=58180 RepID=UPI000407DBFD|nr:A24 family peptidase [Oleidesulfovibrio alaskensis]
MQTVMPILLVSILMTAVVTDIRAMRIPNWLTFPAMFAGLAGHGAAGGADGLLFSLAGLGLGAALMLLPFLAGVMGAGDVKLMGAAGAFLGAQGVFGAFIWTSFAGGAYALGVLLFHLPQLRAVGRALHTSFTTMLVTGEMTYTPATGGKALPRLCYGVAIAAGTVTSMYFSGALDAVFSGIMAIR